MEAKPKFLSAWILAPFETVEFTDGVVFKKQKVFEATRQVDLQEFADKLITAYERLDEEGYNPISVIPVNTGSMEFTTSGGNPVGEVGYSVTRGAVVMGQLKSESD